jgi:phenylpropionate dioxygenase-like ring-hydroxylating dioxygenase large terminal subunit
MTSTTDLLQYLQPAAGIGTFYDKVLDADTRTVPDWIYERSPLKDEPVDVDKSIYLTDEAHREEVEKLWKKVWQMACRVDEIAEVGDSLVYEVADLSFVVVRVTPTVVKAYYNACLHRGRKLVDPAPCAAKLQNLRCAFHGFTWDLEGSLEAIPGSWDFPHIDFEEWQLPEARVALWQGFVFINPDLQAAPFEDFIGDMGRHFEAYDYENRYVAGHVVKVVPSNWKAAQEAFMESFHVLATHPQLLAQSSNLDSVYDCWGNYSRAMTPNFLPSAFLTWLPTEQEIMDAGMDRRLDTDPTVTVPEGSSARVVAAAQARDALAKIIGTEQADGLSDAEMTDSFYFTLFPNLHPWAAYNRICFRFRPYGNDPNRAIQDAYILNPYTGEKPPAAKPQILTDDEDFTAGTSIGPYLARILNQDLYNMPQVQAGLRASKKETVTFSRYQEAKIRHFHLLLQEWLRK